MALSLNQVVNWIQRWVNDWFVRNRGRVSHKDLSLNLSGLRAKALGAQVDTGSVALVRGNSVNAGYIEWRTPHPDDSNGTGTRLGYMGWAPDSLNINLENGNNLKITGGSVQPAALVMPRTNRTISAGTVSGLRTATLVLSAQSGTADNLDTITGGVSEQLLILRPANGHIITAVDGTGNLRLNGDFAMNARSDRLLLQYDSEFGGWAEIARTSND